MLADALEEEVNSFLGRQRYERGKAFRGYRNGYHPPREVTVGLGPVKVRVPRVAKVPSDVAPGFDSQIVRRYQRASQTTQRLFAQLYLEGLATGDFEPVFRELVGETTALSANSIVRLKERWEKEYEAWRRRPLWEHRCPYVWADGVYLRGWRRRRQRSCVSWVVGRMVRRNFWRWPLVTGRVRRVGVTRFGIFVTEGWKHLWWQRVMALWGYGQLLMRSIPPRNTSDAGITVSPTSRPSCRNAGKLRHGGGCER
jgi:hypothetical protein